MYVDSHCHLDKIKQAKDAAGLKKVLANAAAAKVEHMLCVCVTLAEFEEMQARVAEFSNISVSCGAHPLYVAEHGYDAELLRKLASRPEVVAVGETGLDYFYDADNQQIQKESFAGHVDIAVELDKPLIIHTRAAQEDTLAILREGKAERCGGVLHCFTESYDMAKQAIDELDFYISISGIASFANAKELRETVQKLPLERILIETDSPWLAPVPHRGKENQPAFVADVAKCVADVKNITLAEVAEVTRNNFYQLFRGASPTAV
ncbi:TatD DNase family protein [Pseudidiomarina planktonica]|uniref:TatD DNase family protein n=1 Tax=Pseudidiomarina planktonica TaxID=1323738 RepID=A0A1Y6ESD9_9GAMM|nr:TatD family hydrolase [Pseudidiomarina planktonica]RUO65330.1 TatD family deoxyribonuclease [Pseudidiomarina planktonica]SMQ65457.1 TatD DNase family protein [Pseudidiomarina planktonica]